MLSDTVRTYHDLYETAEKPLLYCAPWWLDATCGEGGWDTVIKDGANGRTAAALPFQKTSIRGLSAVITPPLTQWVSPITSPDAQETDYQSLLRELPKSAILDLTVKPDTALLHQSTGLPIALKYSFIIPWMESMDMVRKGYNEGLKRNLRQADKNYRLEGSDDLTGFLSLCEQTYKQRQMKPPHWLSAVIRRVYHQLTLHQTGTITVATFEGQVIAGILTAWDTHSAYYLAGGRTADDHGASAHALLLDNAIAVARARNIPFDFEGSMHPGIANFFQSFGAVPVSYWQIRQFKGLGKLWSIFH